LRQARVLKRLTSAAALALASAALCGCDIQSFIDPSEMYPYTKKTIQKPILTSLSSIDPSVDDPDVTFYNATEVKPIDNKTVSADYRIGVGDLITVSVNDLVGLGVETTKQTRVSESGNISMPLLGQVKAVGLTEDELQLAIADQYRIKQIITQAQVSVTVAEPLNRTFSAIGAVNGPGKYSIPQSDFRILDALVMIHDASVTIDTMYVIRQISEDPSDTNPAKPPTPAEPGTVTPPTAAPGTPATPSGGDPLAPKGAVVGAVVRGDVPIADPHGRIALMQTSTDPLAGKASNSSAGSTPFQFGTPTSPGETRTIRVPLEPLRNGDLRYNIVIRPHDLIVAPNPPTGEYYMSGHIARGGVYSVPPRGITLKQAVIAAGMLDGVAIPQRTELIRRVGANREVWVAIDTNAIFSGAQPDIFLKPNDILHVGTNILAPFIAAVRGGFRFTYGFGFLYDRNFFQGNSQ
jgi:polysaccharide export outer membrane protein